MSYQPLTPTLHYHSSGSNNTRVIIIKADKSTTEDPIIDIPGTAVLIVGIDARRQLRNWFKSTTNPREKFNPPLSGNTEHKIKKYLDVQKYKLSSE